MKVIRRSYLIPMILIIVGGGAFIASNFEFTVKGRRDLEFLIGVFLMILGFLLWAIPELGRYMRKMERRRQKKVSRVESTEGRAARYPRSRR
jgi:hypothetical protein